MSTEMKEVVIQLGESNEKAQRGGSIFPEGITYGKKIPVDLIEKAMAKASWSIQLTDGKYESTLAGIHAGYNGKDTSMLRLVIDGAEVLDLLSKPKWATLKRLGVIVGDLITDVKFITEIATVGDKQKVTFHESGASNFLTKIATETIIELLAQCQKEGIPFSTVEQAKEDLLKTGKYEI